MGSFVNPSNARQAQRRAAAAAAARMLQQTPRVLHVPGLPAGAGHPALPIAARMPSFDCMAFPKGARKILQAVGLHDPLLELRNRITRPQSWRRERNTDRFFRRLIPPGSPVFDIAAHQGALGARFVRRGAREIAPAHAKHSPFPAFEASSEEDS
jgi:hypothetical protein